MSEETFGLVAIIMVAVLFCGFGFFIVLLEPVDRWLDKRKKKRARQVRPAGAAAKPRPLTAAGK